MPIAPRRSGRGASQLLQVPHPLQFAAPQTRGGCISRREFGRSLTYDLINGPAAVGKHADGRYTIADATDGESQARRSTVSSLDYRDTDGKYSAGKYADFHAMRHTFISAIVAAGATAKTCQELARHSTSRLTLDRYAHARSKDKVDAIENAFP